MVFDGIRLYSTLLDPIRSISGWAYDVEMIKTLEHPHLTPQALLIPLDFLLRNRLQCNIARDIPDAVWAEGFRVVAEESGVAGRELGVTMGGGVDGPAARRSTRVHWWYVPCRALPYAMTMMWGLWYIHGIVLECSHPRGFHTYHDFSKRASPEDVAYLVLLFLVRRRRLHHHILGDVREHLVVVAPIVSESVTMLSLDC